MHRFVALALCLLVAGASASASCGSQGLAGGWAPITEENSKAVEGVINAALAEFENVYSVNVTCEPCEQPSIGVDGCQQVRPGAPETAACRLLPAACRLLPAAPSPALLPQALSSCGCLPHAQP